MKNMYTLAFLVMGTEAASLKSQMSEKEPKT